jgi:hypothetical protein
MLPSTAADDDDTVRPSHHSNDCFNSTLRFFVTSRFQHTKISFFLPLSFSLFTTCFPPFWLLHSLHFVRSTFFSSLLSITPRTHFSSLTSTSLLAPISSLSSLHSLHALPSRHSHQAPKLPVFTIALLEAGGRPLLSPPNVPRLVVTLASCVTVEQRRVSKLFMDEVSE